jgi:hypothetical protein
VGGFFLVVGVCLMAAALDLSPCRLPGQVLQQLLDLVVAVVAGGWCNHPHLTIGRVSC